MTAIFIKHHAAMPIQHFEQILGVKSSKGWVRDWMVVFPDEVYI